MRLLSTVLALAGVCSASSFWLENIKHQGNAPFAGDGYSVFRNVKDYGATGDGVTDDTAAINKAISDGNRCGKGCTTTTTTPALVYFPAGTYVVSSPIMPYYFTQMVGDATDRPTIKPSSAFTGLAVVDADPYFTQDLNWISTTMFYRQMRNFIIDSTGFPATQGMNLIHWPIAQATSLQNIDFVMPTDAGVKHVGIFMESGSGGLLVDLTFKGGSIGANLGNQQFTARNLAFDGCVTAITQIWDWTWTYVGLSISNCQVGIDMTNGGTKKLSIGSVTLLDSTISNTGTLILTAWATDVQPATAASLVLENVALSAVPVAVLTTGGSTLLAGSTGSTTIAAWAIGHRYEGTATAATVDAGATITANSRPPALVGSDGRYFSMSKPQYETLPAEQFVSAIGSGAKGDGTTDDTAALQAAIDTAAAAGSVVFLDYGLYKVTSTITIPAGTRMVGEAYPVILSSGAFFADMAAPKPVLQIGNSTGAAGRVELSDFIVSGQGAQAGAIMIEYNLASAAATPAGMWDVHTRIGGFKGSNLQLDACPKITAKVDTPDAACIAAFMSMHITKAASGLYMENNWLWTADHDLEDASNSQITIYAGRGLNIESTAGTFWLWDVGCEHHVMYQFQIFESKNIFLAVPQSETPYYQPNPAAPAPFTTEPAYNDPDFSNIACAGDAPCAAAAWGLRVVDSADVLAYGAGHYSFFSNWDATTCSTFGGGESCQARIVSLEGAALSNINLYNLATIGSVSMLTRDGADLIAFDDNVNVFPSVVEAYRSGGGGGDYGGGAASGSGAGSGSGGGAGTGAGTNGTTMTTTKKDDVGAGGVGSCITKRQKRHRALRA